MKIAQYAGIALLVLLLLAGGGLFLFLNQAKFGKVPGGERLARIERSPHYRDGQFRNLVDKPSLAEGTSFVRIGWEFFFRERERPEPPAPVPSLKTDLKALPDDRNVLVWFGHSSYFIQIDGRKVLVDPVFGPNASPFTFTTKPFAGTNRYTVDDMPFVDYLFITHDHWDHLDYETIPALKDKVGTIVCGLGVGAHLEYWGIDPAKIIETDWGDTTALDPGFIIHTETAHHFSGRGLRRNPSLWVSYVLQTPSFRLYLGGDSGYGPHFADIGARFGGFDVAILENGQYDENWKYNHMFPEETLRAAADLKARNLFPVHSGKFRLSNHPWDEPLRRIAALNGDRGRRLLTPMVGEAVRLGDTSQVFTRWWENLR